MIVRCIWRNSDKHRVFEDKKFVGRFRRQRGKYFELFGNSWGGDSQLSRHILLQIKSYSCVDEVLLKMLLLLPPTYHAIPYTCVTHCITHSSEMSGCTALQALLLIALQWHDQVAVQWSRPRTLQLRLESRISRMTCPWSSWVLHRALLTYWENIYIKRDWMTLNDYNTL